MELRFWRRFFLTRLVAKVQRNSLQDRLWIFKHLTILKPHHTDPVCLQRGGALIVIFSPPRIIVDRTVQFDC